jgi:hypothetical protein
MTRVPSDHAIPSPIEVVDIGLATCQKPKHGLTLQGLSSIKSSPHIDVARSGGLRGHRYNPKHVG